MKRGLSCLLLITLCFSMLPIQAFAVSDDDLYTQYPYYLVNEEYRRIEANTFDICQEIINSQNGFHEFEAIIATFVDDAKSIATGEIGAKLGLNSSYEESIKESAIRKLLAAISAENMSENEYNRRIASEAKKWMGVYKDVASPFKDESELSSFLTEFLTDIGVDSKNVSNLQSVLVKKIPKLFTAGSQGINAYQTVLSITAIYGYQLDSVRVLMDSIDKNSDLYKDLQHTLDQMMDPAKYFNENYTSKAVLGAVQKWIEKGTLNKVLDELKKGSETLNNASWALSLCKSLYFTFVYEGYKVDDYAEAVYLLGYASDISTARAKLVSNFRNGVASGNDIARHQELFDLNIIAQIAALHSFAGLLSVYNRYDLKMKAEDQAALLSWNHDYNWYIKQCRKCLEADLTAGKAVKGTINNQGQPTNNTTTAANNLAGNTSKQNSVSATNVVSEASALVGKYPYVSGGKSPSDGGFDCSGLVYYVYHDRLRYDMTYQQVWSRSVKGEKIESKPSLAPGDIVFGLNNSGGWHTGIYIGNNTMIHAGSSKGVSKTSINGTWFTFKFAIRPSGLKKDTSTPTNASPQKPQLTSNESGGSWFIYVPANYKLLLYSNAASNTQASYCSPRKSSYRVVCTKKAVLSNGTTRYYGRFNTNDQYWFDFDRNGSMVLEDASVPGDCTVTFNANGGSVSTSTKIVKMGGTYGELPTPTKEGYNFGGWYTAPASIGKRVIESTVVDQTSNQMLYARWTITITFELNGHGSIYPSTMEVESPGSYDWLPTPESDAYSFDGWYTELNGGRKVVAGNTLWNSKSHTLYAHWANIYEAILDPNGGTVSGSASPIKVEYKDSRFFPTPARSGYLFEGWYTEKTGGQQAYDGWTRYPGGAHFYAHWTPIVEGNYTVTFDSCGGDLRGSGSIEVPVGGTYGELPFAFGPTFGSELIGWFTAPTGGKQVFNADTLIVNADHTLYAHYEKKLYTIIFDPNGGTVARPFLEEMSSWPQEYIMGANAGGYGDLPNAAWPRHEFLGWFTAPVGGTKVTKGSNFVVKDDHTLYAHWN